VQVPPAGGFADAVRGEGSGYPTNPNQGAVMTAALATHALTAAAAVTQDHWDGPGAWWPIFPIFWLLFLIALISFGFAGRRRWGRLHAMSGQRAGEARLAERFAAGEIDEQEYERRLATLRRLGGS
jgi:putative membrane protein